MRVGDVVVSTGCIRDDGTTRAYVPDAFPAVATHEVVTALRVAAAASPGRPPVVGVTHCKGSFYSEVPGYVPDAAAAEAKWAAWVGAGAVATEMEAAALFIVGAARNLRTGVILAVLGVTKEGPHQAAHGTAEALSSILTDADEAAEGKTRAIAAAVRALRMLIRHDTGMAGGLPVRGAVAAAAAAGPRAGAPAGTADPHRGGSREKDEGEWRTPLAAFVAGGLAGLLVAYAMQRR